MYDSTFFPVLWRCFHWCDGSQVAAPGQQQAKVTPQRPGVWHHHQPHPLQQPLELLMWASCTAQVRDPPETTQLAALLTISRAPLLAQPQIQSVLYLHICTSSLSFCWFTFQPAQTLCCSSLCFLPTGGWTPAATVQTLCVRLHLSRKANKSETALPSVSARWSKRNPERH